MTVRVEVLCKFRAPKEGEAPEECEDRYGYDASRQDVFSAVVSDGASTAAYSGQWAQCLVERFTEAPEGPIDAEWLSPAVRKFTAGLHYDQMPWFALVKISRGAFATLTGLVIDLHDATISAVAVGDSCLAWQDDQEDGTFPMTTAEEFATPPHLICHLADRNTGLIETQQRPTRELRDGSTHLFLMTDALAAWYLVERSEAHHPWEQLLRLGNETDFESWLQGLRSAGKIRDDDVTLVAIHVRVDRSMRDDVSPITD